jgi:hypothetical protein
MTRWRSYAVIGGTTVWPGLQSTEFPLGVEIAEAGSLLSANGQLQENCRCGRITGYLNGIQ